MSTPNLASTLDQAVAAMSRGDNALAFRTYKALAIAGEPLGQHCVGWCFEQGIGTHVDYSEAARWWTLAARAGIKESMFGLGFYYETGRGVEKDLAQAYGWYQAAAQAGYREATDKLRSLEPQLSNDERTAVRTMQLPNTSLERTRGG